MSREELTEQIGKLLSGLSEEELSNVYNEIIAIYVKKLSKKIDLKRFIELYKELQEENTHGTIDGDDTLDIAYKDMYDANGILKPEYHKTEKKYIDEYEINQEFYPHKNEFSSDGKQY